MWIDKKEVLRLIVDMFNAKRNIKDRNWKIIAQEPDWYIKKTWIELFLKVTWYWNQLDTVNKWDETEDDDEEQEEVKKIDISKMTEEEQEKYRTKLVKWL
jgi:GTPase involved in cell partitioning and DNA repair